jgi:GGDEF domain-containing protein
MSEPANYPKTIILPPSEGRVRWWPHLVVLNYQVLGETFRLVQPETIVGRDEEADVRPFHGRVSRRHARLLVVGERVVIDDLGSSNGTRVGDDAVTSRRILKEGDVIVLGDVTRLRLTYSSILDKALRRSGCVADESAERAANSEDFFDLVRIEQVRARALGSDFTLALFRIDPPATPEGDAVEDAGFNLDETMRKVVAIVRDTISPGHIMARPSEVELVVFARMSAEQTAQVAERIRARLFRAAAARTKAPGSSGTLTVGILPLPTREILAPETILCAAGEQVRNAMVGKDNRVVRLPALDLKPAQATRDDASS